MVEPLPFDFCFFLLTSLVSLFLKISVFLEDQTNLELFSNTAIPEDVTDFYVTQIFAFNPTFSPIK